MIYVTSDLHGCGVEKLEALLEKAGFGEDDFLFILGDVIDRGESGAEMLLWMTRQSNVQLILGNHEAMLLGCRFLFDEVTEESLASLTGEKLRLMKNWMRNGGNTTLRGLEKLMKEAPDLLEGIWDLLEDAPLYEMVTAGSQQFLLVHAGLGNYEPGKPPEDYEPHDLLWTRPNLSTRYDEDYIVVFGHTPTEFFGEEFRDRWVQGWRWVCIDTGASFGRDPMLMRLDDGAAFYLR